MQRLKISTHVPLSLKQLTGNHNNRAVYIRKRPKSAGSESNFGHFRLS